MSVEARDPHQGGQGGGEAACSAQGERGCHGPANGDEVLTLPVGQGVERLPLHETETLLLICFPACLSFSLSFSFSSVCDLGPAQRRGKPTKGGRERERGREREEVHTS